MCDGTGRCGMWDTPKINGSGGKMTEYVPKTSASSPEVSSACATVPWCLEMEETERLTPERPGR